MFVALLNLGGAKFNICVFRHEKAHTFSFENPLSDLVGKTRYRKFSKRECAPGQTDCLTAIYYIMNQALQESFPLEYIGNMPRRLLKTNQWSAEVIALSKLRAGDVIFVKDKKAKRALSHVGLALSSDKIFHCSSKEMTATVQPTKHFFSSYEQALGKGEMIEFIDERSVLEGERNPCK